ncbi:ABC transporter ATP-binding protein [Pelagibius marinus]|uniref:ABC transporter ATP-binding protein n=1 Tax=Pelagibius marinus TaxID=2762760 RepID=UPI0018728075|nr:ABC transporter ATP-binding protein [Pelagibius marinus]
MPDPAAQPAIRLSGIRKDYRLYGSLSEQALDVMGLSRLRFWRRVNYRTFTALDGIDLDVMRGERVGIVGRNGAGKTTLLKLITGNFAPTAGRVEVDGAVQALMQTGLGFHGEFTGMENIRASLVYNGLAGDALEEAVADILDFCELEDFIDQPVKTYSLGMRTRLQFAAATAIKPDIVIIDEVLGAGDAYFAGKSVERIRRLTQDGATLLIVSHSMAQILQFSTRAVWLDGGKIVSAGAPLDIVNQYEEFINNLEQDRAAPGAPAGRLKEVPQWILEKTGTGEGSGADWGGSGPLRIDSLQVVDANGKPVDTIKTGEAIGFAATVSSDQNGSFPCSCLFTMYNEGGDVVGRMIEPQRSYDCDGAQHRVIAWLGDNPIGQGKYIVSAALFRDYDPAVPTQGHRYHILSRGYQFRVKSERRDTSRIVLTPDWRWQAEEGGALAAAASKATDGRTGA